jgi:hypothetical protein
MRERGRPTSTTPVLPQRGQNATCEHFVGQPFEGSTDDQFDLLGARTPPSCQQQWGSVGETSIGSSSRRARQRSEADAHKKRRGLSPSALPLLGSNQDSGRR